MITQEQLKALQERAAALSKYLDIENKKIEVEEEELRTHVPDFWNDQKAAEAQMRKIKTLRFWINSCSDVDKAVEEPQGLHLLVGGGVPDHGDGKTAVLCKHQGVCDLRHKVGAGHEIDVRSALVLKREEDVGEVRCLDGKTVFRASLPLADHPVLAEDAGHVAAGEEHGAGAARTGDHRLLIIKKGSSCRVDCGILSAKARSSRRAVDAAVSRAQHAMRKIKERIFDLISVIQAFSSAHKENRKRAVSVSGSDLKNVPGRTRGITARLPCGT